MLNVTLEKWQSGFCYVMFGEDGSLGEVVDWKYGGDSPLKWLSILIESGTEILNQIMEAM
jgi:hypothetical protein